MRTADCLFIIEVIFEKPNIWGLLGVLDILKETLTVRLLLFILAYLHDIFR